MLTPDLWNEARRPIRLDASVKRTKSPTSSCSSPRRKPGGLPARRIPSMEAGLKPAPGKKPYWKFEIGSWKFLHMKKFPTSNFELPISNTFSLATSIDGSFHVNLARYAQSHD